MQGHASQDDSDAKVGYNRRRGKAGGARTQKSDELVGYARHGK